MECNNPATGRTAYLFPGQGAQHPQMGKDFLVNYNIARQTFEEAEEITGLSLRRVMLEGSENDLRKTLYAQLLIFTLSAAITRVMAQELPEERPCVVAGLSLGELTALHYAGSYGFSQGVYLVHQRAQEMQRATERVRGGMLALQFPKQDLLQECLAYYQGRLVVANYNTPDQLVLSGELNLCEDLQKRFPGIAKRMIPLAVEGAFHSPLMRPAAEAFLSHLALCTFTKQHVPVISNYTGKLYEAGKESHLLFRQIDNPVQWVTSMDTLQGMGVDRVFEIGPGGVLSRFLQRMYPGIKTFSIDTVEKIHELLKERTCC